VCDHKNAVNCLTDLKAEGTALVASLRANSSIPYGVNHGIIESLNHMLDRTVSNVQNEILKTVQTCDISDDDARIVQTAIIRQAETLREPFDFWLQDTNRTSISMIVYWLSNLKLSFWYSASKPVQGNLL
jgi:hypothetical protein